MTCQLIIDLAHASYGMDISCNREMVEQVVGHIIQKSIETGIVKKSEMVVILEDMIQSVERGTLAIALENA